ncbi:MAG: hypothetical protein AAGE84_02070 [Cyanobacteria bacterium P01_G01_bin.39]
MDNENTNLNYLNRKKVAGRELEANLDRANDVSNDLQNVRKHLKNFVDDAIATSNKVTSLSRKGKSALVGFGTGLLISLTLLNPAESNLQTIAAKAAALSTTLSGLAALVVPESEKEKLIALGKEAKAITLKLEELSSDHTLLSGDARDRLFKHYDKRLTMIEEKMSLIDNASSSRQAIDNIRRMRKIRQIIPEEQFNEKTNRLLNPRNVE